MKDYPKGGIIGKTLWFFRAVAALRIGIYSASASFFIALAAFPALLLLLGLLRPAALEVEDLSGLLWTFLPGALVPAAQELIFSAYDNSSGIYLGLSALTALWSAGKGVYGLMAGLNAMYGLEETRGYLRRRVISVGFTFALLLVLVLTLGLDVFWGKLEDLGLFGLPVGAVDVRFLLLLGVQVGFFCAMFLVLPDRRGTAGDCLPGAVLAAVGWRVFSGLYSLYAQSRGAFRDVYGSVYAWVLCLIWLYCCVAIVLAGGALNGFLEKNRKNRKI